MTLPGRHLDDAALGAVVLDPAGPAGRVAAHLQTCERCRLRAAAIAQSLHHLRHVALDDADRHFSAADLERQRRTIATRIARLGEPARVLAFPERAAVAEPIRLGPRWLAVSAAVGLAVGVVSGQWWGTRHDSRGAPAPLVMDSNLAVSPAAVGGASLDDSLLSEVEDALQQHMRAESEALDALTPVNYEIR